MSVLEDREYWDVVHELDKAQKQLCKADHDRKRYAKRIRYLEARHEVLAGEYRAVRKERDILQTALTACERRLADAETGQRR